MSRIGGRRQREQSRASSDSVTVRAHRPDYQIVLFMGILMLLGLVVMYAIGPQRAQVLNAAFGGNYGDMHFFTRQALSLSMAVGAFLLMAFIPFKFLLKHATTVFFVGIIACAILAIAGLAGWGIAQESYGATRWFDFGFTSLQPAEILKFGVLLHLGGFLGLQTRNGKINDLKETLLPVGIILGLSALFIIIIQRDLGTGVSLFAIALSMLFVGGINKRVGAAVLIGVIGIGILFILSAPHRIDRVATFLRGDDTSVQDASAYHVEHAKIAIGTGGLFGVGIGNSVQATGYLPEAINDSVFAIMGEIFGFVGLVAVLFLFIALMMRLLKVIDHLVDYRLRLLVAGVFGWFGSHVILNVGAMIGLIPLTGITLPLLSFGGTSMAFIAAGLGLAFQLSRYTVHGQLKEDYSENIGSRRRVRRTRHTSSRSSA